MNADRWCTGVTDEAPFRVYRMAHIEPMSMEMELVNGRIMAFRLDEDPTAVAATICMLCEPAEDVSWRWCHERKTAIRIVRYLNGDVDTMELDDTDPRVPPYFLNRVGKGITKKVGKYPHGHS